jgi:hypothetical protein
MATLDPEITGGRRRGGNARKAMRRGDRGRAAPDARLTLSIPEAGKRYFGLSKNGSYDAAARGEIPTIKIGKKLFVPVRAMEALLDSVIAPGASDSASKT